MGYGLEQIKATSQIHNHLQKLCTLIPPIIATYLHFLQITQTRYIPTTTHTTLLDTHKATNIGSFQTEYSQDKQRKRGPSDVKLSKSIYKKERAKNLQFMIINVRDREKTLFLTWHFVLMLNDV